MRFWCVISQSVYNSVPQNFTLDDSEFMLSLGSVYLLLLTPIFILYVLIQMFLTHLIRVRLGDIPKIRNMSTLPLGVGVEFGVV